MRKLALLGLLVMTPSVVQAQNYPSISTITVPEVEVRSGPTTLFYATSKLKLGDSVTVRGKSKDQPDWLAIMPPPYSFSWINIKNVTQTDAQTGYVKNDDTPLRPGSLIPINDKQPVEPVKIQTGSQVTILGKAQVGKDGESYLPIQPWPTEVRYIPADAVQARQFAGNNTNATVPGQLASMSQNQWNAGQPAQASQQSPWPPAQTASFSQNSAARNIPNPATWSPVGILRRANFDVGGQPAYNLVDKKGKVLMYVNCPGLNLRDYVGLTVSVYGSLNYRADAPLATYYLTASHVAKY